MESVTGWIGTVLIIIAIGMFLCIVTIGLYVVINKKDLFTFDRFIDRIQDRPIHELKIAENFDEFLGANINDDNISVEDTSQLLDSYIEAADPPEGGLFFLEHIFSMMIF